MGERGTYSLRFNGEDKAVYNHSGSNPRYLGKGMLEFLASFPAGQDEDNMPRLQKIFENMKPIDPDQPPSDEIKQWAIENKYVNLNVSRRSMDDYYCLFRNRQNSPRELLKAEQGPWWFENMDRFIENSLFCEYAYVANLDSGKLEVWKGFQTQPEESRYEKPGMSHDNSSGYVSCHNIMEIPLSDIFGMPQEHIQATVDQMIRACDRDEHTNEMRDGLWHILRPDIKENIDRWNDPQTMANVEKILNMATSLMNENTCNITYSFTEKDMKEYASYVVQSKCADSPVEWAMIPENNSGMYKAYDKACEHFCERLAAEIREAKIDLPEHVNEHLESLLLKNNIYSVSVKLGGGMQYQEKMDAPSDSETEKAVAGPR